LPIAVVLSIQCEIEAYEKAILDMEAEDAGEMDMDESGEPEPPAE
jgi:hypothetical protein